MSRSSVSTVPPAPLRFSPGACEPTAHVRPMPRSSPPTAPTRPAFRSVGPAPRATVLVASRDRGSLFRLQRALRTHAAVVPIRSVEQLLDAIRKGRSRALLIVDLCAPSVDLVAVADAIDAHCPSLPTLLWGDTAMGSAAPPTLARAAHGWRRLPPSATPAEVMRELEDML